ncbi:cytochrome c biogenesis protein CcsA [Rossellomorea aquimaris]|jgi:HemX protein|uniref:Cytochrome C assembly protein n=1 Tax=Rossellomorea aquimaris TaxID=189382 RepID=A0A1J6VZI6_9BACI|nr:cytochrome c biogenesis protein CcsA [Rossellomorea aquimaris]OIU70749.1 cytochrome C assembly protein [Rossellomorea aquimaris]
MFEQTMTRLHELMIVLYAISILFYFIDFLNKNRKANLFAFWLLAIVWVLQTIFLFLYMIDTGRFPVLTIFEGLYFYAWVLITLSLVINRLLRVDFTVFFTNVLGFIIMAIHTFAPVQVESRAMAEQLVSELLLIHITMAILSYGAFSLSFVFSLLYLLQFKLLKEKKWGQRLWRISDLSKLEKMSYILNAIGVAMLLLSLILGLQWAFIKLPNFILYDPKIIGSFILLILYSIYLYLRIKKNVFGKSLAMLNAAAFLIILINFFLGSRLSSFHFWYS